LEKTSKKLLPIYKEVLDKISVIEKAKGKKMFDQFDIVSPNDSSEEDSKKKKSKSVRRDG